MRNLKKYLAVAIAFAMSVSAFVPTAIFAASDDSDFNYADEAKALYAASLYKGLSETEYKPDLGSTLNRQTGVTMLLRLVGEENEALKLDATKAKDALKARFKDASDVDEWAVKQVAYAVEKGYVKGYPDGTFKAKSTLVGKAYCSLLLQVLGKDFKYDEAGQVFGEAADVTDEDEVDAFGSGDAIDKDTFVGISYKALGAKAKGEEKNSIRKT